MDTRVYQCTGRELVELLGKVLHILWHSAVNRACLPVNLYHVPSLSGESEHATYKLSYLRLG
jgi:hypothetical protein